MNQTYEKAFETQVEEVLLQKSGWHPGTKAEWDVERALFPTRIFAFLQETQAELWEQMRMLHGDGLESLLLNTLVKELNTKGTLHVRGPEHGRGLHDDSLGMRTGLSSKGKVTGIGVPSIDPLR